MKRLHLIESAFLWAQHVRNFGCLFDADRKAAEAVRFCLEEGATSFAVPSKLEGTRRHQAELLQLRKARGWQRLGLHVDADTGLIVATWQPTFSAPAVEIGHIRPKHASWLLPLLETGRVRCYVLRVTGGPEYGRQHRGCNVVLSGLVEALAEHAHRSVAVAAGDGRPGRAPVVSEARYAFAA